MWPMAGVKSKRACSVVCDELDPVAFFEHQKTVPEKEKPIHVLFVIISIIIYCIIIYVDHYNILFLFIIVAMFTIVVIFIISSINITIIYE